MKFSKTLIALSIISSLLFSCKEKAVVVKSKTEYLAGTASKTWKITKAEATEPGKEGLKIDLVVTQPACVTDNILIFAPNNTYEFREGATKCGANDPDLILKANWTFLDNETKFKIDKIVFLGREVNDTIFEIVELNDNIFTGKTSLSLNGTTYNFVATFQPAK